MIHQEDLKITGELHIVLIDERGNVKIDKKVPNIVTTAGKSHIAARIANGSSEVAMGWMSLGTGTATPVIGNTSLSFEVAGSRVALSSWVSSTNTITATATFPAGSGTANNIIEAGIFNNATVNLGSMLSRTIFTAINKGAGDTLSISWVITVN